MASNNDDSGLSRREVLRKSAVVGVAGLGMSGATFGSAGATTTSINQINKNIDLSTLNAEGVILTIDALDQNTALDQDAFPSEAMRTGQQLLKHLAADGLIEEASLNAFPNYEQSTVTTGSLFRVNNAGKNQIIFTTQTSEGRLQITYSENSLPSASLFPKDGGAVIMYTSADGANYRRFTSDLTASKDAGNVSTLACNCSGCTCEGDWCLDGIQPKTKKWKCLECKNGSCVVLDSCGC